MPRQLDSSLLNARIANNPNNRISAGSVTNILQNPAALPEVTLQAIETFINTVLGYLDQVTGLDLKGWATQLEALFGPGNLLGGLMALFNGLNLSTADPIIGAIVSAIQGLGTGLIQQIMNAIVGGVTGSTTTGSDPVSVLFALLNQTLELPLGVLSLIFGGQATNQAQINAINNGGFTHDFASNGVTGWNNLLGTLALSSRGNYIQATNETVAYRSSGVSGDKFGAHFVINPSMRGVVRGGICSTSTASNWAGVEVYRGWDGDALRVVTGASPTLTVVQAEADFTGTNRFPGVVTVDVKTDGVNQLSVLYNNQPVTALNSTDTGIVTHGSSNRNVLLTSNGFDRNQDGSYGPAILKVVSYGW